MAGSPHALHLRVGSVRGIALVFCIESGMLPCSANPGFSAPFMNYGKPACIVLFSLVAVAANAPVPVREEPRHKVVLENDYIRLIDVHLLPGDTTLYHVHTVPSVVVELSASTIASQEMGKPPGEPRQVQPGETRYAPYDETPLTHRVINRGTEGFHVMDIELLRSKTAGGFGPVAPQENVKVAWEQKLVRLYDARIEAGKHCEFPPGDCAHLLIGISGSADTSGLGGKPASDRRLVVGEYLFFPAQSGFQVKNAGAAAVECVLLELK
jgi:hypothetical protein